MGGWGGGDGGGGDGEGGRDIIIIILYRCVFGPKLWPVEDSYM